LPPHVCRIFTAENNAHRASVEDVCDGIQAVGNFQDPDIMATPTGSPQICYKFFRLLPTENEPMSSPSQPIEPVLPIQLPVKHASEPPANRPTVPPLVPPIQRPTVPPLIPPVREPNRTPLVPPVQEPNRPPLRPPVREPNRTPLVPPVQEPNRTPLRPPVREPNRTPLVPPIPRPD
jgi:hypothetical protein